MKLTPSDVIAGLNPTVWFADILVSITLSTQNEHTQYDNRVLSSQQKIEPSNFNITVIFI